MSAAVPGTFGDPVRVIGWGGVRHGETSEVVGIIVDPNNPARLVVAPDVVDPSGGEFARYGYAP